MGKKSDTYNLFSNINSLHSSNNSLHTVFNSISEGISIIDLEGKILICNDVTFKLHGYSHENEIIGKNFIEFIKDEEHSKAKKNIRKALQDGSLDKVQYNCIKKDGSEFLVEISLTLLKNEDNEPIGFLSATKDISEITNANKQIILLITALESAANSIVITDKDGDILWVNSSFNKLTGYSDNEVIGENPRILKSGAHDDAFYKKLWDTIISGKIWSGEIVNKNKAGELYYEDMTITPIYNEGELTHFIAIKQNITENKKAKENANLLTRALKSISEIVVITDTENKIIFINEATIKKTSYLAEEIIGKPADILFSDNITPNMTEAVNSSNSSGDWKGEVGIIRKDKSEFPAILNRSLIMKNGGDFLGFVYAASDISKRKAAEEKLYGNERKFRSLFENSTIGIYRANKEGKLLMANNQLLGILGFDSIADFNKADVENDCYVDHESRKKFKNIIQTEGKVFGFEARWKRPNGEIIYIRESAQSFWDYKGQLSYYEGTLEDITQRVKAEEEIKKHAEVLKALRILSETSLKNTNWLDLLKEMISELGKAAEVSRVHIFEREISEDNEITFVNKAEWVNENIKAQTKNDSLSRWDVELSNKNIINGLVKDFPPFERKLLESENVKSILIVPIFVNNQFWGAIEFHECSFDRVWSPGIVEALKGAAETLSSSIQRKNHREELIAAKKEAEKSDRLKSEFLAQMSHEIRTPLNNILNFTSLIKEEVKEHLNEDLLTGFYTIQHASERLIRTISLILNMSEIQAGTYRLNPTKLDLYSDVLLNIYNNAKQEAKEKGINFTLTNIADTTTVKADRYSAGQIFSNLIDNAIKFTSEGTVEIVVKNSKDNKIVVQIIDTGVGISEEYLPDLFNAFSQEQQGYTRKFDGNGLGLTLTKQYCNLNNAQIDVSSQKSVGSIFTVKFNTLSTDN
ncbi:autoinducer 2 sensor kinase/phosphatase LuxQ [bacterium BMS3Abin04]|nr:autoinducer 2 sensor kinase/phosphatase LuxQ [bacterium BMS3Abin04]